MATQQALPKAANFGDLALNQGTNMEIDLQVANIGSIERVGKNNTPCQKCILKDQIGNQEKCTIWMGRTGTALADINQDKWLTFNLSASKYKGENQYGGFWQMDAPVITQAPPNAPQATNATARTIVPQGQIRMPDVYAFPVTPETQKRMSRSVGAEVAGRVVAAMISKGFFDGLASIDAMTNNANGKLLEIADMMTMFILKKADESHPADYDDRPVCQKHGVYADECGCAPF